MHPPDASDTVRWRVWGRYAGHEAPNPKKLERTVRYRRAWQEWANRKESPRPPEGAADRDQGGAGQPEKAGELVQCLSPAVRNAYLAFEYAQSKKGKLLEDQEAHELLKEEGIPENAGASGELEGYKPPYLPTFVRYLGRAGRPSASKSTNAEGGARTAGASSRKAKSNGRRMTSSCLPEGLKLAGASAKVFPQ